MSDKNEPSPARRAGRGLFKALRAVFGRRRIEQAVESAAALRDEFDAGKAEAEAEPEQPPPPRTIPHEVVDDE